MPKVLAQFRDRGFIILAVPCNQFGQQEPAKNADIHAFAQSKGAGDILMLAKSTVNAPHCRSKRPRCGAGTDECCKSNNGVYKFLQSQLPGKVAWNFEKFLVGRDGKAIKRYPGSTAPLNLVADIEAALAATVADREL